MRPLNIWVRVCVGAVAFATALGGLHGQSVAQDAESHDESEGLVEVFTRYQGTLVLRSPTGSTVPVHITVKELHLSGHERNIPIHQQGFYIANLRWGSMSSEVGNQSGIRRAGDFWTVEEGAHMTVRIKTPGEEAFLQIITIQPVP